MIGLVYLQSARHAVLDSRTGFVSYQQDDYHKYLKWPYFFAIIWIFHLIVACQHFIVASSICRWYFSRPKSDLTSPILSSYWILIRYSFGSIALGSLVVSGMKMIRLLFRRIENLISRYDQAASSQRYSCQTCCLPCVRTCQVFMWMFEKILIYLNTNAYIEIAITGKNFASAARRAFVVLSVNAFKVTAVNTIGDFLLFLSKILIVLITLWTGAKLMQDRQAELTYSWSPLIVSGLAAYFVAHCFLSVYEMAIDALLICYCEDRRSASETMEQPSNADRVLISLDNE
jgi:solute carrier family 44 protein 1 (choline transporter-like protein)